ncbi:MAG: S8 family serine peptidase [Thermoanaerobaculales bacterium]|nr:S8 family serine peptidase [Thermoanaerobaculales bacterium]
MKSRLFAVVVVCFLLCSGVVGAGDVQDAARQAERLRTGFSEVPGPVTDPMFGGTFVVIPENWRTIEPFASRFGSDDADKGMVRVGSRYIDLAAHRFTTWGLISGRGADRTFTDPDMSSFPPGLVGFPFASGPTDYFIVQATSPRAQSRLRSFIDDRRFRAQVRILEYLPESAFLVELDRQGYGVLPEVREIAWVGYFHPAWRVQPTLDYVIEADPNRELGMVALFDATRFRTDAEVLAELNSLDLAIVDVTRRRSDWKVRLRTRAFEARKLVLIPGCLWVERWVEFQLHNNIARSSSNITTGRGAVAGPLMDVEDVWARGIRGEGQIAAGADTGLSTGDRDTLHEDFGVLGSATNPMRVIKGYALGRATWDDDQNDDGGHGTHTSGSIVGNGVQSGSDPPTNDFPSDSFAGTAPKAQFVFQSVLDSGGGLGGLPADLNDLFGPPYVDGARVHSNSWGAAVAGDYTTDSQNLDEFAWDYKDMVITFSAGNSGVDTSGGGDGVIDPDSIGAPGTAKNCITVGAAENYRPDFEYGYDGGSGQVCNANPTWGWFNGSNFGDAPVSTDLLADNANGLGAFSSRGPTNDGRFKPEIVAPGIAIISTRTDVNQDIEQWGDCNVPAGMKTYYLSMGGTSMANPLTAGAAVLVRQYYEDGWHANGSDVTNGSAVSGDGFNPSSALVKATMINGAWHMEPGQYGTGADQEIPPDWDSPRDSPNNAEGFGRVDLEHSLFPGDGFGDQADRVMEIHDISPGLITYNVSNPDPGLDSYTFDVTGNGDPLIVTLVWTDPYGAVSAGTELVNNLDLVVNSPSVTRYYPNRMDWIGGSADTLNNTEQVYVSTPAIGQWSITVRGTAVPGNSVGGTTVQPYALVISGVSTSCTNPDPVSIDSITDDDVCVQDGVTITFSGGAGASSFELWDDGVQVATGITSSYSYDPGDTSSHSYIVRAVNGSCHTHSASSDFTDTDYRPTFGGLQMVTAMPNNACGLRLDWNPASSACSGGPMVYNVYRDTTSGFTPDPTPIMGNMIAQCVTDLEYEDTSVGGGTTYYYVVRAEDSTLGHGGPCGGGYEDTNTTEAGGTPSGGLATLYSENFDAYSAGDSADWAHDVVSGSDYWKDVRACLANSAPNVYRFGSDSCSGNYHSDSDALAYPLPGGSPISVPPGATGVSLSFAHDWDFAAGDGASLWLASATTYPSFYYIGGTYLSGQGYTGTVDGNDGFVGSSGGFATTQVDLSQFCTDDGNFAGNCSGEDLYVTFNAFSDVMSSLYQQAASPSDSGKSCQDFEAAYNDYDAEGAADFVVPAGGWVLERVDIPGHYSTSGPLDSVDVLVYSNSSGMPDVVVCSNMGVGGANLVDTSGDLQATLPTPCDLSAGTYWLGIQGNMDYGSGGQWYWQQDDIQSTSYEGVWRNPGNGFGTGCTSWTYLTTCGSPADPPDYVFTLWGHEPATGWNIDDVELTYGSGGACSGAPDPVQQFTARSTDGTVKLEWQNPDDVTYSTTRICVDTGGFPTNPGTTTEPGCSLAGPDRNGGLDNYDTMAFAGSNGTTYYFAAFVDNGSGEYSASKTVKAQPFDTGGKIKWAYSTGASALAPPGLYPGAAGTGAAYGLSNDRVLHGMNSTGGGGDWPRTLPFDWMPMGMNGPAQDRPPIVPTTVGAANLVAFLGSQDGHVYAVNAKTGETLWQSELNYGLVQGAPAGIFTAYNGDYDLLFAGSRVAGSGNSMHAINPANGFHEWSYDGTIGIISSAATVDYATNRLYFASRENPSVNENTLWCIEFTNLGASLLWAKPYGDIDSAPVLFDGVLYVGTNAGLVMAVNPEDGEKIWTYVTIDGSVKGFVDFEFTGLPRRLFFATTTSVWSLTDHGSSVSFGWQETGVGGPSIPLTLADQGVMFVGSTDGRLYQLNTITGIPEASRLLGAENVTVGSPGYDWLNSMAYVGAEDGSVYAVTLPLQ